MADGFHIDDFSKPIYLHHTFQKFWEIKLDPNTYKAVVRCGKLEDNRKEDVSSIQRVEKSNTTWKEAVQYAEKHVQMKISKGYDFMKGERQTEPNRRSLSPDSSEDDFRNGFPKEESKNNENGRSHLKRRIDEPLQRDNQKQVKKMNEVDDEEEVQKALKKIAEQEELEENQRKFGDYNQKAYRIDDLIDSEKLELEEQATIIGVICDFGPSKILLAGYQTKIDDFVIFLKRFLAERKKKNLNTKKEITISPVVSKFASYIEQKGLELGIICEVHEKYVLAEGKEDKIRGLEDFIREKEKEALTTPKKNVVEDNKNSRKEIPFTGSMKKKQAEIEQKAESLEILCEFTGEKFRMLGSNGAIAELLGYLLEIEASPQKKEEEENGDYTQKEFKITKAFTDNMPDIKKKIESLDLIMDVEGEKALIAGFEKRLKELEKYINEKEKETKPASDQKPAAASLASGNKEDFIQKEVSISTFQRAKQEELEKKAEELGLIADFGYDVVLISGTKGMIGEFISCLYEAESDAKKALYPKYWDFHEVSPFSMEDIPLTSPEFHEIDVLFQKTMAGHRIHSMQRIQNKYLMDHYVTNIQKRMELRPKDPVNRMLLFHGTRNTKPEVIYKNFDVGFDLQYANQGMYGKGLYFAVNANYSHNGFVYRNGRGNCQLIVADVFVGRAANSGGGNIIKAPEGYDSVTAGGQFYILYNNFHSYPLYLIEYK